MEISSFPQVGNFLSPMESTPRLEKNGQNRGHSTSFSSFFTGKSGSFSQPSSFVFAWREMKTENLQSRSRQA
jgi:hypothetical protein